VGTVKLKNSFPLPPYSPPPPLPHLLRGLIFSRWPPCSPLSTIHQTRPHPLAQKKRQWIIPPPPPRMPTVLWQLGADWHRPDREGFAPRVEVYVGLVNPRTTILNANDSDVIGRIGGFSHPVRLAAWIRFARVVSVCLWQARREWAADSSKGGAEAPAD